MTATDPIVDPVDSEQRAYVIQPAAGSAAVLCRNEATERLSFEILAAFSGIQTPQTGIAQTIRERRQDLEFLRVTIAGKDPL
jgi:hypothetical protein